MDDRVEWIGDGVIRFRCRARIHRPVLRSHPLRTSFLHPELMEVDYRSEKELASILSELRDLGFLFAGAQAGWPPSAVMEHLRDLGLIRGEFLEITWRGPGDPILTVK